MVDLPDSYLAVIGVGIPILLGFFYFIMSRKDRGKFDTQTLTRSDEEAERDKQELARKVKKELQDEAEKVETIRKTVAVDVREESKEYVDRRILDNISSVEHKFEMYEQKIEGKFSLSEERNKAKFVGLENTTANLMSKIVESTKIQADALTKINESIEYFRRLLNEMSNKVQRVEKEQEKR